MLIRLIKLLFFVALLGAIGLVGYSYFGDMTPHVAPQSTTVTLDAD